MPARMAPVRLPIFAAAWATAMQAYQPARPALSPGGATIV